MQRLFNLLTPYDIYERHQVVGEMLAAHSVTHVLDVGGQVGSLARFLDAQITSLNVDQSAELNYDGKHIPFEDGSFAAVVSLDTLEHIPPDQRAAFIQECLRVTQRFVIIAAPFGSPEHCAEEQRLDRLYEEIKGVPHHYLREHVRYGIPTQKDIAQLMSDASIQAYTVAYAGDFLWQSKIFERSIGGQQSRLTGLLTYVYSLALFHPIRRATKANPRTNRFYLFIDKQLQR